MSGFWYPWRRVRNKDRFVRDLWAFFAQGSFRFGAFSAFRIENGGYIHSLDGRTDGRGRARADAGDGTTDRRRRRRHFNFEIVFPARPLAMHSCSADVASELDRRLMPCQVNSGFL